MEKSDFDEAVMLDTKEPMIIDNEWSLKCDECGNTIIHKDTCSKKEKEEGVVDEY